MSASRTRVTFPSAGGQTLAAAIDHPPGPPHAFALFAHCFTCGKDIAAASRIARTLAGHGIAVMRFDFTGLGGSEGDFANTDFGANVDDVVAAAEWLRREHMAPSLLVGHSLGGTTALAAARDIPEVRAVATIAAPASAEHVVRQFSEEERERIRARGRAEVTLAGRTFEVGARLLEAVAGHTVEDSLPHLGRALLVMHAPFDSVVGIDHATRLFTAAKHPKSFVSLDDADHLLSRIGDAQYAADTIAAWASRYLERGPREHAPGSGLAPGSVHVAEGNRRFLREVASDDHAWLADEPEASGGDNLGPDPYELLLASLGACTSMTIRMYANRKGIALHDVDVRLEHERDYERDCEGCDEAPLRVDVLRRRIRLEGELEPATRQRLLEIANRCPVHRTLTGAIRIETQEKREETGGQAS